MPHVLYKLPLHVRRYVELVLLLFCYRVQIHFVEESELVVLILTNTLAQVQPFLQSVRLLVSTYMYVVDIRSHKNYVVLAVW